MVNMLASKYASYLATARRQLAKLSLKTGSSGKQLAYPKVKKINTSGH